MSDPIVAKPLDENEPLRGLTKHVVHIDDGLFIPRKPRVFLTLMAGPGSLQDLKEMFESIREHFNGICAVYFGEPTDDEADYLEANRGAGRITYLPYVGRHDLARNVGLHCGKIENDDIVVVTDALERPAPTFCRDVGNLLSGDINTLFFFGKILAFRYHESATYVGTPHERFARQDGQMRAADLAHGWGENKIHEAEIRANVRPQKRPPTHYLNHYLRYYISMPWGGNHCVLGNEHRGDPWALYHEREKIRLELREYLRSKSVSLTPEGFIEYIKANPKDPEIIRCCNAEKITNDIYRVHILGDHAVNDNHHWQDMVTIPVDVVNPDSLAIPLDTDGQPG